MLNIRREEMGVGEHRSQGAQIMQVKVHERCEQGAEPPSILKNSNDACIYNDA